MYAALALLAAVPRVALAQAVVTVTVPAGDVSAGATVPISCRADGTYTTFGTSYDVLSIAVSATGGSLSSSTIPGPSVRTTCAGSSSQCNVLQGSVNWTAPADPGTFTVTCAATIHPFGGFGTPPPDYVQNGTGTLTTVAGTVLPPVVDSMVGPAEVVVGTGATFSVIASDPNVPPRALTYTWTATGGTVNPDAQNPWNASWLAPADPGGFEVAVTVSNGAGSVELRKAVSAVLALPQQALALPVAEPRRLAVSDSGDLFVVDGRQGSIGEILLATRRGETRGFATVPEPALAAAYGAGFLWVTTTQGNLYKVDAFGGRTLARVTLQDGSLGSPLGIAWDPTRMTLWVADYQSGNVRLVRPDGTTVRVITDAGGSTLAGAIDVAVDAANGRAWVLRQAPPSTGQYLHAFDLDGNYLGSYVGDGAALGQLSRAGGMAVGPNGRLYVSDAYQGVVQVYDGLAVPKGTVGSFGAGAGQLTNPFGLAIMKNGDLAVANLGLARVDRFGSGAALPTCAGDADCDGLPDAWETAHGFNPSFAGDSLLDADADGLANAEEYARGTNPHLWDSDGDGTSDGAEVLAGTDPLNPNDNRPTVAASGPGEVPPGLVKLYATASAPAACGAPAVAWTQASGGAVTLKGADTSSPTFIARAPGAYAFDAVASCGGTRSAPSRVTVTVLNVPPVPDAGRLVVSAPGGVVGLDARFSSDANGDTISTYDWDQTLGRALSGKDSGLTFSVKPRGPGLYKFMVTATDPSGATASAEVPVLVQTGETATAVALANPAEAQVGQTVALDATASFAPRSFSEFSWAQVAGPDVTLAGADQPVASFVPPAAGRYAFEVSLLGGPDRLRSPPARVEVLVAAQGGSLPAVQSATAAGGVVDVGTAVELKATGTGTGLAWRQVAGPAAGLTYADTDTASAVPFSPGYYVFEVVAKDGAAESHPARVAFEARAGGKAIPVARISVPGLAPVVGQLVFLDGRASTGAARFRWTQTAGPWVTLGTQSDVTTFRPTAPGVYAFELEVDDGVVRSAPARVEVNVSEQGVR